MVLIWCMQLHKVHIVLHKEKLEAVLMSAQLFMGVRSILDFPREFSLLLRFSLLLSFAPPSFLFDHTGQQRVSNCCVVISCYFWITVTTGNYNLHFLSSFLEKYYSYIT
jgi:hypothetical protein